MNQDSGKVNRKPRMIAAVRVVHALIALVLIGAIVVIYYVGITGTSNIWFYLATAALAFAGIVIALNKGDCPFLYLHRRYGDEKRLIELVMPRRFAKLVIPLYAIAAAIGYVLVLLNLD